MNGGELPVWTWLKTHPWVVYPALALIAALWITLALL